MNESTTEYHIRRIIFEAWLDIPTFPQLYFSLNDLHFYAFAEGAD